MIFNTVEHESMAGTNNTSKSGGIQNIKSMKNLKSTIMSNQSKQVNNSGKFKISEKEIQ